jgi:hypothetical protein
MLGYTCFNLHPKAPELQHLITARTGMLPPLSLHTVNPIFHKTFDITFFCSTLVGWLQNATKILLDIACHNVGYSSNSRLLTNAHLPFDRLMALSHIEGLRCPARGWQASPLVVATYWNVRLILRPAGGG